MKRGGRAVNCSPHDEELAVVLGQSWPCWQADADQGVVRRRGLLPSMSWEISFSSHSVKTCKLRRRLNGNTILSMSLTLCMLPNKAVENLLGSKTWARSKECWNWLHLKKCINEFVVLCLNAGVYHADSFYSSISYQPDGKLSKIFASK